MRTGIVCSSTRLTEDLRVSPCRCRWQLQCGDYISNYWYKHIGSNGSCQDPPFHDSFTWQQDVLAAPLDRRSTWMPVASALIKCHWYGIGIRKGRECDGLSQCHLIVCGEFNFEFNPALALVLLKSFIHRKLIKIKYKSVLSLKHTKNAKEPPLRRKQ